MSTITGLLVRIGVDNSQVDRGLTAGAAKFDRYTKRLQASGDQAGAVLGRSLSRSGTEAANGWVRGADGRLRNSTGQFVSAGEQAAAGLGTGMTRGLNRTGSKLVAGAARTGRNIGLGLTVGTAVVLKSAVQTEAAFSQTMATIGASTGTTGKELEGLGDLALDMGAKTSFSANESAEAMLELAKGGLTAATIQSGALEGTLTLAAAGGTSLATAATIGSNSLNAFSLSGKDMNAVAAALAGGANASSASVESLGQALSQVGPGAVNAGLSLQETVGTLSAFDAAGIKGSDAGTSLKTMLSRLVPQTEKQSTAMDELGLSFVNSKGEIDSIETVAGKLQDRLGGLSQEQRTTALATIFGSDATRAATVLMREGEAGLGRYIKATQDQGAAQKMAQARMSGTAGALERLSGSAETAKLRIGQEAAPAVVFLADKLADNLVPATDATLDVITSLWKTFDDDGLDGLTRRVENYTGTQGQLVPVVRDVVDAGKSLWTIVKTGLIPAFGDAATLLPAVVQPLRLGADVLGFFADNAGLTRVALGGYIAYLGVAKLAMIANTVATSSGVVALRAYAAGTMTTGQMLTRLGWAARLAAGVGGMALVTASASSSNKALGTLGTVAGATAAGFAVGGPWGAAAGAVGGVGLSLFNFVKRSDEAAAASGAARRAQVDAAAASRDYSSTLDATTGALTRQTREQVRNNALQAGVLELSTKLDISNRDLIGSVLGQEGATRRLTSAYQANYASLTGPEQAKFNTWLSDNTRAMQRQSTEARTAALDNTSLKQALQGFPPEVIARVKTLGTKVSADEIRALKREFPGIDNRKLRQIVNTVGTETSIKKVRGVRRVVDSLGRPVPPADLGPFGAAFSADLGRVKGTVRRTNLPGALRNSTKGATADFGSFTRSFATGNIKVKGEAKKGGNATKQLLEAPIKATRANLGGLNTSVRTGIGPVRGTASSGGLSVGSALQSGIINGFAGTSGILAAQAYAAVSNAVAAGRRAGAIRSPSRKTFYTGKMLGRGLIGGQDSQRKGVVRSSRNLVGGMLKGLSAGDTQLTKKLEGINKKIANLLGDKKISKAAAARARNSVGAITKSANALAGTRGKSNELRDSVTSGIRGEFDLAALTSPEANQFGFTPELTFGTLSSGIATFVNRVVGFAKKIGQMRKAGIPGGLISEVAGLGSTQGSKVADLLLSTSGSQKTWLRDAYGKIDGASADVGRATAGAVYGDRLTAQQANVQRELNRARGGRTGAGNGGGGGKKNRRMTDEDLDALAKRLDARPVNVKTDVYLGGRKLATVHQAGAQAVKDRK